MAQDIETEHGTARGVVDVHAHFVTPRYVEEAKAAGIEHPDGMPGWPSWSVEDHLALMDRNGIGHSVLSISSPGVYFGDAEARVALARHVNDFAADVQRRHPDRFSFFASVPLPDVDAACAEVARAMDELGAKGVVVETNVEGVYLADPRFEPFLAELDRRGAALFVHPTSPPAADVTSQGFPRPMLEFLVETTRTMTGLIMGGVTRRHPDIDIIATHCGGFLSLLADRLELFASGLGGLDVDPTLVRQEIRRLWFDLAGTPVPNQVPALLRVVDDSRLLYGSDYCWTPAPLVDRQVAALDEQWAERVPWRELVAANAARFLG